MNDDEKILRRKRQNAERARAYRKRKKELDAMSAMTSTSTVQSDEPVSENIVPAKLSYRNQLNAERCRRYRQRCKLLKSGANFNYLSDVSDGQSSSGTGESNTKFRPSTCQSTKLIPLLKSSEEIIARVYNYLQTEYEELKSSLGPSVNLSPLANILKRTAAATGISEHTVSAILEQKKRAAEDERDVGAAKRAKLTHLRDGDASPNRDEESSCEAPDKQQGGVTQQDDNSEQTEDDSQDGDEFGVVTLKVEIEDETYYRPPDPLQSQPSKRSSATEHQLPITNFANVTIKTEPVEVEIEPIDIEYPQSSFGVVQMTSLPRIKSEPDDVPAHSSTVRTSDMVSATLCNVKCEPPP